MAREGQAGDLPVVLAGYMTTSSYSTATCLSHRLSALNRRSIRGGVRHMHGKEGTDALGVTAARG